MKKIALLLTALFCGLWGGSILAVDPLSMVKETEKAMKEASVLQRSAEVLFASDQPQSDIGSMRNESKAMLLHLAKQERQYRPNNPITSSQTRQWNDRSRVEGSVEAMESASDFASGPAEAVLLHNGEISFSVTDFSAPDRGGVGFSMVRHYRSHLNYNGPLGNGWDHSHNIRILANAEDEKNITLLRLLNGEQEHLFTKSGENWIPGKGTFLKLEWNDKTRHIILTDPDLTQYDFEPYQKHWRIQKITSRIGKGLNALTYQYHPESGQLQCVTDPYGNKFLFSYNEKGLLQWVYGNNQIIRYNYDFFDCLITAKIPAVAIGLEKTVEFVNEYHWQKIANRFVIHEIASKSDKIATRFEFSGNKVSKAGIYAITHSDLKNEWSFQYSETQTRVQPPVPFPEVVYTFDLENQHPSLPIRREMPARKATWDYQFNEDGLMTLTHTPDGQTQKKEYDTSNPERMLRGLELSESTLGNGKGKGLLAETGTRTSYLPNTSFPIKVEHYQKDQKGKETILGNETYSYTDTEYLLKELVSFTVPVRYWYNTFGEIALQQSASGTYTLYFYGAKYPANNETLNYADGSVNGAGLCVRTITDAKKNEINLVLRELKNVNIPAKDVELPAVNLVTHNFYSPIGKLLAQKVNRQEKFAYSNLLGDTILQFSTQTGVTVSTFNSKFERIAVFHTLTSQPFDEKERLCVAGFSNPFYKESYVYNAFGQVVQYSPTNECFGKEKKSPVWKFDRTPSGLLLSITNPNGVKRVTTYNTNGQMEGMFIENDGQKIALSSGYQYSPEGNVLSFKNNANALTVIEYNDLGNKWKTISPDGVESITEQNGMGKIVSSLTQFSGEILTQKRTIYGENMLPLEQRETLRFGNESSEIVSNETQYDKAGRAISSREIRKNSWTTVLYDGLDRRVAVMDPAGNMAITCFDNGNPVFTKQIFLNEKSQTWESSGVLSLYDASDKAWINIPVDSNGKLIKERACVTHTDLAGNVFYQKCSGVSKTYTTYDSLGQKRTKKVIPATKSFSEKEIYSEYGYDLVGNPIFQTTGNDALGVFGTKDAPNVDFVSAPQTVRYKYDALGRPIEEKQPDGLRIQKKYNLSSLVEQMDWIGQENQILRSLQFGYDNMQRVVEVVDKKNNKVIRSIKYNAIGDMIQATDNTGLHTIVVERAYDSIGLLRTEDILCDGKKLPQKQTFSDLEQGTQTLKWTGANMTSPYWRTLTLHFDPAGRAREMDLDYRSFCNWKYMGDQFTERTLSESRLTQSRYFNAIHELTNIDIVSNASSQVPRISLEYSYGKRGEVESASSLILDTGNKKKMLTQYYQYDSFMNLVSENKDAFIPKDTSLRRMEIFHEGTDVVSKFTNQMRFDQAGNVWTNFSGMKETEELLPGNISSKNTPSYYSPASIAANPKNLSAKQLEELASNRCTTIVKTQAGTLSAKEYKYDDLGCLTEYSSIFTNSQGISTDVRWHLEYDTLGRLSIMNAFNENDKEEADPGKSNLDKNPVATLKFAYDALNRRILKEFEEFKRTPQKTATLYDRNHPCLILNCHSDGSWSVVEQYLWGVESQELLMAVIPESIAEHNSSSSTTRYYIHQDRGYSVIASTKIVGSLIPIVSTSSYLAFGENSSTAEITSVVASGKLENSEACFDNHLDDKNDSVLTTSNKETQFLEIRLEEPVDLMSLQIFAQQFPSRFEVYRIPGEEESPTEATITEWIQNAKTQNNPYYLMSLDMGTPIGLDCPYVIPLPRYRTNRIVLVWKKTDAPKLSIREFQVDIVPDTPGAIAFAGQWHDSETGLYYQLNRYRLPELNGKFISPDPLGFADGMNFYAYAHNNPLSWHDPDGKFAHIVVGGGVGAVLGGGYYALNCWWSGSEFSWSELGVATLSGGASGALCALAAPLGGVAIGAIGGGVHGLIQGTGSKLIYGGNIEDALVAGAWQGGIGSVSGAAGGLIGGAIFKPLQGLEEWSWIAWAGECQPLVRGLVTLVATGAGAGAASGAVGGTLTEGLDAYEKQGWGGHVFSSALAGGLNGGIRGAEVGAAGGALVYGGGALANKFMYKRWGFTKSGQKRIWAKARKQYWKNEAKSGNTSKYTSEDLARMEHGMAPKAVPEGAYPLRNSVELHHKNITRRSGIPQSLINQKGNLQEVSPREHVAIHQGL